MGNDMNPGRVRRLPEALANRIAAGEVVERPASVVKELLENAIDAGAKKIVVELEQAGKGLMRISDDGCGMSRDDALLAIERHATSKIKNEDDLFAITSFGFRGEALPSIASVSHFTLTTRAAGDEVGTRLHIEGGELTRVEEVAALLGTVIEARHLFYNTPARQKFQKSDASELSAISDTIERVAMAHPGLRLILRHNKRDLLNLAPVAELDERLSALFGPTVYAKLFPISAVNGRFTVRGMLSAPELTRPNPSQIHLFLNGRPIRDRSLQHAVTSSYGMMLEPKRFPLAVVLVTMPVEWVDVNVHPAKSEVRFADARQIYSVVQDALRDAIGRAPWASSAPAPAYFGSRTSSSENRVEAAIARFYERSEGQGAFSLPGGYRPMPRQDWPAPPAEGVDTPPVATLRDEASPGATFEPAPAPTAPSEERPALRVFSGFPILAQLHKTYILVETPYGLGFVDQHAAHERITFERLKAARQKGAIERQNLLFPLRVDLDHRQMAAFSGGREQLAQLGFDLEEFGGDSLQVRALPAALTGTDVAALLRDLLDDWAHAEGSHRAEDAGDEALATMACHASVRANQALSYEQMEALLRQMDRIDFGAVCPHGRPVFVTIPYQELEKRFGRIK